MYLPMKKRVLIAIDTFNIGGPGKGLIQFLRCGGNDLCDPVIVSFNKKSFKNWPFGDAIGRLNVKFEFIMQKMTYDPLLIPKTYRLVSKYNIQVLQSHGYKAHLLFFILKYVTGLPWVAYVHGWTAENWKIKLYNMIDKFLFRFADRIVVVSSDLAGQLNPKWIDPKKVITVKNAIEPLVCTQNKNIRDTYSLAENDLLIGVIGRFSPEKGQLDFVEAMAIVIKKIKNVKALLVGDGQQKQLLQMKANDLNISNHIIFTGFQDDVAPFYDVVDLIVLPSLSEGMPNVALEAMVFGKPVVATDVGGVPEVVIDGVTGKLVPAQNPERLAEAILAVLEDRKLLEQYGGEGKKRVLEEFDPYKRAQQMVNVYEPLKGT